MDKKIEIRLDYSDMDKISYEIYLDKTAKTITEMAIPFSKIIMVNENLYKIIRVAMGIIDDEQDKLLEALYPKHIINSSRRDRKKKEKEREVKCKKISKIK